MNDTVRQRVAELCALATRNRAWRARRRLWRQLEPDDALSLALWFHSKRGDEHERLMHQAHRSNHLWSVGRYQLVNRLAWRFERHSGMARAHVIQTFLSATRPGVQVRLELTFVKDLPLHLVTAEMFRILTRPYLWWLPKGLRLYQMGQQALAAEVLAEVWSFLRNNLRSKA